MTAKERRGRRQRPPESRAAAPPPNSRAVDKPLLAMPVWRWRTFPVFFAFSVGLFLGVYAGWFAGFIAADSNNQTLTTVVFIVAALFLGFSLSRITTRFVLSRKWIKPRPRRQ